MDRFSERGLDLADGETAANGNGPSDGLAEFVRYVPQLDKMSEQLKQTSAQIEQAVVDVCASFQGIAARARALRKS